MSAMVRTLVALQPAVTTLLQCRLSYCLQIQTYPRVVRRQHEPTPG
jgi:hypothetical protein